MRAPGEISAEQMRDLMGHDKKVRAGQLRLVLLDAIGQACLEANYPESLLMQVLEQH